MSTSSDEIVSGASRNISTGFGGHVPFAALVEAEARILALQEAVSLIAEAMNYQRHNGTTLLRDSVETFANCARRDQWDGSVEEFARLLDAHMQGSHTPRRYTNGPLSSTTNDPSRT